jgi:hypothetical protein
MDFLQRRLQKEQWAKEQDADLKLSQLRHMEEKERFRNDQMEIQELNRRNAEKELIKEENYKNVIPQTYNSFTGYALKIRLICRKCTLIMCYNHYWKDKHNWKS